MIIKSDGVYENDTPLTNFALREINPLFAPSSPDSLVAISMLVTAPGFVDQVVVTVERSMLSQILEKIPTARVTGSINPGIFDNTVLVTALKSPKKGLYFDKNGFVKVNDNWVFLAGSDLLGDCGGYTATVSPNLSKVHLACNQDSDEKAAIENIVGEMKANKATVWPTYCFTLAGALRSHIMNLGISTFPALYVYGPQNYGKTTLVSRCCLLYESELTSSKEGLFSANSTAKGLFHELSEMNDQVVLVDDLAKASCSAIEKKRMELVADVLRYAANDSTRYTASNRDSPQICRVSVAFTGEFPLKAPSDLTRILEIHLQKPIIGNLKMSRSDAATAFRAWIRWLLPRFDNELASLAEKILQNKGDENARINTTKIILNFVNELFFRFALEMDIVDRDYYESMLEIGERRFSNILDIQSQKVIRSQQERPEGNLSWYIQKGYRNGAFHVVERRKQLINSDDCIIEKDCLCIRSETLLAYLVKQPNMHLLTDKQMIRQLKEEGVFGDLSNAEGPRAVVKEKRTAKKKIKGHRYLELNFEALRKAAKRYL